MIIVHDWSDDSEPDSDTARGGMATDWPLKTTETSAAPAIMDVEKHESKLPALPYEAQHDDVVRALIKDRKRQRQMILFAGTALLLSVLSLALAVAIAAHFGVGTQAALFITWITVSAGATWILSVLVACMVCTRRPGGKPQDIEIEDRTELRRVIKHEKKHSKPIIELSRNNLRFSDNDTDGSPLSLPKMRGRMTRQDFQHPSSSNYPPSDIPDLITYTPLKGANQAHLTLITSASAYTPRSPFDVHPNPLTSSPPTIPAPSFPSSVVRRPQHQSSFYGPSNGSPVSKKSSPYAAGVMGGGDPFRDTEDLRSASEISLTSTHAKEVEVKIARVDSLKKIRAATMRRSRRR